MALSVPHCAFANRLALVVVACSLVACGSAQSESRGRVAVYPVVCDNTGTDTSQAKAREAVTEVFRKDGFEVVDSRTSDSQWKSKKLATPTLTRPPQTKDLGTFGRAVKADYVCTVSVTFHTRSIWVNLGPKRISRCHMTVTIVNPDTGKIVYEAEGDGGSDKKSDKLKVAGALLVSPLVTAVSRGPKTPQESRAAQIAASVTFKKFVVVGSGS